MAVDGPVVPPQRARLSETSAARFALERLQADVALVVEDQTRALREHHLADRAVWLAEPALEMRLASLRALYWDLKLPVGAVG